MEQAAQANKKCKIKFSRKQSKKVPSLLTDFSNGKLKLGEHSNLKFRCLRPSEVSPNENDCRRILLASSDRLQYSSSDSTQDKNEPVRYMVGVRNTETGKMKLYDSLFFHLKPLMKLPAVQASTDPDDKEEKSYQEKRDDLTSSFGSKFGKKAMSSRLRYATKMDDLSSSSALQLDDLSIADTPEIKSASPNIAADVYAGIIPPKNKDATDVKKVYLLEDIISTDELEALTTEADVLGNATNTEIAGWRDDGTYSKYVLSHLEKVRLSPKTLSLLVYYDYLILFSKLTYKDLRRKDPVPDIQEPCKSHLLQNYTVSTKHESGKINRSIPATMKDKLIAYALVIALFIDNFFVQLNLVQSDMKVAAPKLIKIAQILGCHVLSRKESGTDVKYAELKFPLFVAVERLFVKKKK